MTISLQNKTNVGSRLAPDLTYPTDKSTAHDTTKAVALTPTAGVKSTALSLTGKFSVSYLHFSALIAEAITYRLTIDGVIIWNDVGQSGTEEYLLGLADDIGTTTSKTAPETIICNTSFLLEVTTTTDTAITLHYKARPIL